MSSRGKTWKVPNRKTPLRGRYKQNVYVDCGDYMEIHVKWKDQIIIGKFDKEDFTKVDAFTWSAHYDPTVPGFYLVSVLVGQTKRKVDIKMHRMLMQEPQKGLVVDHINHDTTDNRKSNLRIVTQAQNYQNKKGAMSTNKLGVLGVRKKGNRYYARFKQQYLGCFLTLEEAEQAVKQARAKYMPFSQEAL